MMKRKITVHLLTSQFATREGNADFNLGAVCVCELFKRLAGERGLALPKPFVAIEGQFKGTALPAHAAASNIVVFSPTDVSAFAALDDADRKRMVADLVNEVVVGALAFAGMDKGTFDEVFDEMKARGYENRYVWKRKRCPDRRRFVEIEVELQIRHIDIRARLLDADDEVLEAMDVLRIGINEFALHRILGDLKFADTGGAFIEPRSGERVDVAFGFYPEITDGCKRAENF